MHSSWSKQVQSCCWFCAQPYFHGKSARAWRAGAPGVATARFWRPGRKAAGSHSGGGELGLVSRGGREGGQEQKGRAGGSLGSRTAAHGGFCCVFLFCMKKVHYENCAFLMKRTSMIEARHCPCGCLHPAGAVRQAESVASWPTQAVSSSAFSTPKTSSAPQRWRLSAPRPHRPAPLRLSSWSLPSFLLALPLEMSLRDSPLRAGES